MGRCGEWGAEEEHLMEIRDEDAQHGQGRVHFTAVDFLIYPHKVEGVRDLSGVTATPARPPARPGRGTPIVGQNPCRPPRGAHQPPGSCGPRRRAGHSLLTRGLVAAPEYLSAWVCVAYFITSSVCISPKYLLHPSAAPSSVQTMASHFDLPDDRWGQRFLASLLTPSTHMHMCTPPGFPRHVPVTSWSFSRCL